MRDFFQGGGVDVLFWIINAVIGVAVFLARNRQALYEKMVQKDIERLEKENGKLEADLKDYRELLERRLKDGTSTMRDLVKSVETLKADEQMLKGNALPTPEFRLYCKEHENTHAEQARAIQNLLEETGEVKRAITAVDQYVKGGFQTVMRLLGQKMVVGAAEKEEST